MKLIALTRGLFTEVDAENYDWLMQWKWKAALSGRHAYATRDVRAPHGLVRIHMHRLILGLTDPKVLCDHIDQNGLNNQLSNLRPCSHRENLRNRGKQAGNATSRYKGVYWSTRDQKWHAQIHLEKRPYLLGAYRDEVDAARAYDEAAFRYFGEFACPNLPPESAAA